MRRERERGSFLLTSEGDHLSLLTLSSHPLLHLFIPHSPHILSPISLSLSSSLPSLYPSHSPHILPPLTLSSLSLPSVPPRQGSPPSPSRAVGRCEQRGQGPHPSPDEHPPRHPSHSGEGPPASMAGGTPGGPAGAVLHRAELRRLQQRTAGNS